jgi:hypothetical protein
MRSFPLIALLPAVVLLLVGCGGSDFEGEIDVPDGYETYSGNGVSFVHPAAWAPTTRALTARVTEIRFQDPETDDPNAAAVSFTMQDDVADRFDAMLDSRRELLETTRDAKVSQEAVDVPARGWRIAAGSSCRATGTARRRARRSTCSRPTAATWRSRRAGATRTTASTRARSSTRCAWSGGDGRAPQPRR